MLLLSSNLKDLVIVCLHTVPICFQMVSFPWSLARCVDRLKMAVNDDGKDQHGTSGMLQGEVNIDLCVFIKPMTWAKPKWWCSKMYMSVNDFMLYCKGGTVRAAACHRSSTLLLFSLFSYSTVVCQWRDQTRVALWSFYFVFTFCFVFASVLNTVVLLEEQLNIPHKLKRK